MTHCQRLLRVLSDGKPHSHLELYQLGMIVHSRIADLRAQDHKIAAWSERKNGRTLHFYQLSASPSPPEAVPKEGGDAAPPSDEQIALELPGYALRRSAA